MNSNVNSIKYQSVYNQNANNDMDEEEQAKKLLEEDDGQDWGDDDFKDDNDDVDWGDDDDENGDNQESVDMEQGDGDGDDNNGDEEEYEEDGEDYDDGWGEAKIADATMDVDMKLPEMMKPFEILNPYKLLDYQVKFMKEISEELYIEDLDNVGIMCRYYRWNRGQLMDEYLANSEQVLKKCGVVSSSKALTKPQETGKFDCWLCIQEFNDCKQDTFYPSQCGHQFSVYLFYIYLFT